MTQAISLDRIAQEVTQARTAADAMTPLPGSAAHDEQVQRANACKAAVEALRGHIPTLQQDPRQNTDRKKTIVTNIRQTIEKYEQITFAVRGALRPDDQGNGGGSAVQRATVTAVLGGIQAAKVQVNGAFAVLNAPELADSTPSQTSPAACQIAATSPNAGQATLASVTPSSSATTGATSAASSTSATTTTASNPSTWDNVKRLYACGSGDGLGKIVGKALLWIASICTLGILTGLIYAMAHSTGCLAERPGQTS